MQLILPKEFGWVGLTAFASYAVHHIWMSLKVGQARKKYSVKYPDLYANSENCKNEQHRNAFNCVQRAHQNSLENEAPFLANLIITGLKYPQYAAICGAIYVAGRIAYFQGYASGDPQKRMRGAFGYFGVFGLLGALLRMSYDTISGLM